MLSKFKKNNQSQSYNFKPFRNCKKIKSKIYLIVYKKCMHKTQNSKNKKQRNNIYPKPSINVSQRIFFFNL